MKALFAQDWKGPPEFICRLHWCFPCPLKELNEEVIRAGHPQPCPVGLHCLLPSHTDGCRTNKLLCSGDGGHGSIRNLWSWREAYSLKVSAGSQHQAGTGQAFCATCGAFYFNIFLNYQKYTLCTITECYLSYHCFIIIGALMCKLHFKVVTGRGVAKFELLDVLLFSFIY